MSRVSVRSLALIAAGALLSAGCKDTRATLTNPVGTVYNATFAKVGVLPRGTATRFAEGAPSANEFSVTLAGLEELGSGTYHVWLATQATATAAPADVVPATGTLLIIRTDTIIDTAGDPVPVPDTIVVNATSTFTSGGPATRMELTVTEATLTAAGAAITDPGAYNLVFVTIEPSVVTSPSAGAPTPLWARFFDQGTLDGQAAFKFGNFAPDPASEYVFQATGKGSVGVFEKLLVVDDSSLALPPKGYYYATVLTRKDANNVFLAPIVLGPQKAPYPRRSVSLMDADVNPNLDPVVAEFPPSILAASERVKIDTISGAAIVPEQPFRFYQEIHVTLEAKAGIAAPSPDVILAATFPARAAKPPTS